MGGVLLMDAGLSLRTVSGTMIVQFTRPEIRNPLSMEVVNRLQETILKASTDSGVSSLVFTGSADVFASGADLREIAAIADKDVRDFSSRGQQLMSRIARLDKPTVAAINGYCFGGALDLALACHRRIAPPHAKFAHPGASLGIITGWGGTQRLPRLVGAANAFEMFFTATPVNADRALEMGLIDEIAGDVVVRSVELAQTLV